MTGFPSFSALTVRQNGATSDLATSPSFSNHEGNYYLAVGSGVSSLDITPTLTTASAAAYTIQQATATAVPGASGTATTFTLNPGLNTFLIAVTVPICSTGLYTVTVATASGTFKPGETITGGTSGATAVIQSWHSATSIDITTVSGTFQAEAITGGTSLASGTIVAAASFAVSTNCNTESTTKTYNLKVVRGASAAASIAQSLTLTKTFSDSGAFMVAVKAELVSLLNIAESQITMYIVSGSSGSATVKYTLDYDSTSTLVGEPPGYDASFLNLFSDKDSIMFTDTTNFPSLATATALTSVDAVTCNSACSTSCDPTTGLCVSSSSSDSDIVEDYPMIFWGSLVTGLVFFGFIVYCCVRCICFRTRHSEKVSLDTFSVERPRYKGLASSADEDPLLDQDGVGIPLQGKTAADGIVSRDLEKREHTNAFDALTKKQVEEELAVIADDADVEEPDIEEPGHKLIDTNTVQSKGWFGNQL
jgi:hypothetical protein